MNDSSCILWNLVLDIDGFVESEGMHDGLVMLVYRMGHISRWKLNTLIHD